MPMITPRRARGGIHALLNHGPLAIDGHHKRVQIELKPVLDRRAVDLGGQPAVPDQGVTLQPVLVGDGEELVRRPARMLASAAANNIPSSCALGFRPRFSAPMTEVVMPEECQSMPI